MKIKPTYRWSLLFILGVFVFKPLAAQDKSLVSAYIQKYKDLAMEEMVRTGVPAAISLAQGIIESGAGTTWLATHANNQFGIKCKSAWQGESVSYTDDRMDECFRKYFSTADSWRDHSNFLKTNQRYSFLFYLDPLDYKAWAYGLKEAGYATSQKYARQIIQTIQNYQLETYSRQGLAMSEASQPEEEFASVLNKKIQQEQPGSSYDEEENNSSGNKRNRDFPQKVFKINKREAVYLPEGTELISVAEAHDVPLRKLVRFNELSSDVLPKGMLIFLEKKRKKGSHRVHKIRNGETFHQIAQEEGIRLKWLLKRNHLTGQSTAEPGENLVLKGFASASGALSSKKKNGFFAWIGRLFSGRSEGEPPSRIAPSPEQNETEYSAQPEKVATFEYKVKSGDTLFGISKKYRVSVDKIKEKNHLKGDLIRVGQVLFIPQE